MRNRQPIYIISKSRWHNFTTPGALDACGVDYYVVVEESQYSEYVNVLGEDKVLILPQKYLDEYDTFDDVGEARSKGPGAARNFCWDHAIETGFTWHWVMDDNIKEFLRFNNNMRVRAESGSIFRAAEDFVDRYENIAISGLQYRMFCAPLSPLPPYALNTRIYSCLLINNSAPFRWRGRYNEDTDLSLRALKAGWCTLQFNAFLCDKLVTQALTGGNTEAFYAHEGTTNKSTMLRDMHPDVARVAMKYGRVHHYVDYGPFKNNALVLKDEFKDMSDKPKINNYGMELIEV